MKHMTFSIPQLIIVWCSRIVFSTAGIILLFNSNNENLIVQLIACFSCLFIASIFFEDDILIFDNHFYFRRKYFFNILKIQTLYKYSEIKDIQVDEQLDLLEYLIYLRKNKLRLTLFNGQRRLIKTLISQFELLDLTKFVKEKMPVHVL